MAQPEPANTISVSKYTGGGWGPVEQIASSATAITGADGAIDRSGLPWVVWANGESGANLTPVPAAGREPKSIPPTTEIRLGKSAPGGVPVFFFHNGARYLTHRDGNSFFYAETDPQGPVSTLELDRILSSGAAGGSTGGISVGDVRIVSYAGRLHLLAQTEEAFEATKQSLLLHVVLSEEQGGEHAPAVALGEADRLIAPGTPYLDAIVYQGRLHVFYATEKGGVRCAKHDGSTWTSPVAAGEVVTKHRTSAAVYRGLLALSFRPDGLLPFVSEQDDRWFTTHYDGTVWSDPKAMYPEPDRRAGRESVLFANGSDLLAVSWNTNA
ncbi:MAG: hypothetical protein ACRC20_14030 [Segniliparus sp.]|uniref:hypothetical protein n=1 Tax=Segniliparus sp. TaxID=2804064 RepID=UPI003F3E22A5